jgi:hypothetical protein
MLDPGSTCSLLEEDISKQIGLKGKLQKLDLSGIRERNLLTSERVNLDIGPVNEPEIIQSIRGVWVVKELNLPVVNVDMQNGAI